MYISERRINIDGFNGEIEIDIYGDTHIGNKAVNEEHIIQHVHETKDKGRYWLHLGDCIEGIIPKDERRWDASMMPEWLFDGFRAGRLIDAEWRRWGEIFRPIADKCLGVLDGDGKHNYYGDVADCMGDVLMGLKIQSWHSIMLYLTLSCYRTKTSMRKVPIIFHHGWFAGSKSNKILKLERMLGVWPQVWGFFVGHGHDKVPVRIDSVIVEGKKERDWVRRGAMTGSYLRTYLKDVNGYGERHGYNPVAIGRITLILRPFHNEPEKRMELINI